MPRPIDVAKLRAESLDMVDRGVISPRRLMLLYIAIQLLCNLLTLLFPSYFNADGTVQFSFSSLFFSLFLQVLSVGFSMSCLHIHRGGELAYSSLFDAFPFAGRAVLLTVFTGVVTAVGGMLFVVPGLVAACAYSMAPLYLADDPSLGAFGAMRASRQAMNGFKMTYVSLLFSFLPLIVLKAGVTILSQYLGFLLPAGTMGDFSYVLLSTAANGAVSYFLLPRWALCCAGFYRRLQEELDDAPQPPL